MVAGVRMRPPLATAIRPLLSIPAEMQNIDHMRSFKRCGFQLRLSIAAIGHKLPLCTLSDVVTSDRNEL